MDNLRRFVFAFTIFSVAALIFGLWRSRQEGYGLLDLLRAEKPTFAQVLTSPQAPPLKLDDVQLLAKLNEESSKLAASVLPAVVSVNTRTVRGGQTAWHPFFGLVRGRPQVIPGLGSGAIISKEGHVVTNFHVIENVSEVMITTNDNKKYSARILGASRERDIALLKIEGGTGNFPALAFVNSDEARVGQWVFAVGNPFGLNGTVTQGIISARDRHLSDSSLDYLQTDTVINPGNSGGPLVNIRGQILGINVAIYRGDENVRAWQGIGLAVPANDAKAVVDAILKQTQDKAAAAPATNVGGGGGYLGLELSTERVAIDPGLGTSKVGALITDLDPGSPGLAAGLEPGDVITHLGGKPVTTPAALLQDIRHYSPGTKLKLGILRNGQLAEVEVALGQRPDAPQQ